MLGLPLIVAWKSFQDTLRALIPLQCNEDVIQLCLSGKTRGTQSTCPANKSSNDRNFIHQWMMRVKVKVLK